HVAHFGGAGAIAVDEEFLDGKCLIDQRRDGRGVFGTGRPQRYLRRRRHAIARPASASSSTPCGARPPTLQLQPPSSLSGPAPPRSSLVCRLPVLARSWWKLAQSMRPFSLPSVCHANSQPLRVPTATSNLPSPSMSPTAAVSMIQPPVNFGQPL